MKENERICSVLNELTVEEFLETYSERIQNKMSEQLWYYVEDGLIYADQEERAWTPLPSIYEEESK